MHTLTREEQRAITRYLTDPRGRIDTFFDYGIYFVPSLLFGLYGMWREDFIAVAVGYVVLFGLVAYLISYNRQSAPLLRSAVQKLVENCAAIGNAESAPHPSD
jgi:hypothetical protein